MSDHHLLPQYALLIYQLVRSGIYQVYSIKYPSLAKVMYIRKNFICKAVYKAL